MNTTNKPDRSLVSLFAGCGGSSLGYKQAGFDIKLAVEWDTKAADVYRRNFDETPMFVGDIADLTSEEALEITGLQPGELDVLDGSPPCQGFSTAGQRKFSDSRNRLFEEYVRMIDVFRPKMLVMENVSGLRKGKMKLMFAEMTIALKEAGYKVSCRELNAWWYGVPQDRRRLIWVGVREDLDMEPGHPDPTVKRPVSVREALGILYDADIKTGVRENCRCRPGGKSCADQPRSIDGPSQTQPAGGRLKIEMRNPDFENKWKDGDGVGPTLMSSRPPTISIDTNRYKKDNDKRSVDGVAGSFRAGQKPRIRVDGIESNNSGFTSGEFRDADLPAPTLGRKEKPRLLVNYGRKQSFRDIDGISPTLTSADVTRRITGSFTFPCNADRDGKPMDQPVGTMAAIRPPSVTDGASVRYLTIEESKTLQGFPAWFQLNENEYKFVGNSVCPPMAEALGRHLLRLLAE